MFDLTLKVHVILNVIARVMVVSSCPLFFCYCYILLYFFFPVIISPRHCYIFFTPPPLPPPPHHYFSNLYDLQPFLIFQYYFHDQINFLNIL